jgi:hypothetical protein
MKTFTFATTVLILMMLFLLALACSSTSSNTPALGLFAQEPADQFTLLFRTGFEGDTALDAIPSSQTGDSYQHFSGKDNSTGFSWPLTAWGSNAARTGIHSIIGSGNRVVDYIHNAIEEVTGRSGEPTRALKMYVFTPSPGFCCIQSMFQIAGMNQPVTGVYVRFWTKLNPEVTTQVQANKNEFWRTVWEFKTYSDYRITAFIVGTREGTAMWRVVADNKPTDARPVCPESACWSIDAPSFPVPLDRWFLTEMYIRRSSGADGRVAWGVDGQLLVDHRGPSYGAYQENINFLAISALYGQDANMNPAYQWIDDLEIWAIR